MGHRHQDERLERYQRLTNGLADQVCSAAAANFDVTIDAPISDPSLDRLVESINLMISTAKRSLQDVDQRNRQIQDHFLMNMSHEIRTPLTAIMGFSDLVNSFSVSDEERREFGYRISNNARHLLHLINEILDFSNIETDRFEMEHSEFSLCDMLSGVSALFERQIEAKGLTFHLDIAPEIAGRITTDGVRLKQIVVHLVSNAVKFTDRGSVSITARSYREDEQDWLEVVVSDTGIGMSAEVKNTIFSPFTQADMSVTRKYGGTGLGLALSKRIAGALGGDLELTYSQERKGTAFTLRVPVTKAKADGTLPAQSPRPPKSGVDERLLGINIVVAEDSPDNQILFKWFLEKSSANVLLANDGVEALDLVGSNDVDLVLMDIQMPNMDGYEATRQLRAKGFNKPILALTAHAHDRDLLPIIAAGCDGRITKPVTQNELVERILEKLAETTT